ncbi:MAG: hypothetical protein FWE46_03830 [Coriobacteriia bacterium]|nr:hypothetical protein [Coriobacteriia bacterium]
MNLAKAAADAADVAADAAAAECVQSSTVSLIDLDIINPYFRSSDYGANLLGGRVNLVSPTFAGMNIENPALTAAINGALESAGTVIVDVGGDDAGATVLARYHADIQRRLAGSSARNDSHGRSDIAVCPPGSPDFGLWYVANHRRSTQLALEDAVAEALWQLREIERVSKLAATGIVNNTHLQEETSLFTLRDGLLFARALAAAAQLPLLFSTFPRNLLAQAQVDSQLAGLLATGQLQPVERLVTTPWQEA